MARLPTVGTIGPRPSPRSPRGVVAFRGDIAQRAEAAGQRQVASALSGAAKSFANLGVAIERAERRDEATERKARLADAEVKWQTSKIGLNEKYVEDQDHATLVTRFGKDMDTVRDEIAKGLDPAEEEVFRRTTAVDGARTLAGVGKRAIGLRRDATRAWLDGSLADIRTTYLEAPDETQRSGALDGANAVITAAAAQGAISEEQAVNMRQGFVRDAARGRLAMLDDAAQVAALSDDGSPLSLMLDPAERATLLRAAQGRSASDVRALAADHLASLQATGVGLSGLRERAQSVLSANDFADFTRREDTALQFFEFTDTNRFAPPQNIAADLEKLRPKPGSKGFADRQRSYLTAQRAAQSIIAARAKDPAAYAMTRPDVADAFAKIESGDMALSRAVEIRLQAQEDMGISPATRRTLTKSQAASIAADFDAAPAHERPGRMAALQEQYGRHFQGAFSELVKEGLSPETQILATVVGDITVSRDLSEAIATGKAELRKGLETAQVNDLSRAVREGVRPFAEVVLRGAVTSARVGQINALTAATEDLALFYMKRGASAGDAATRAVNALVGKRYIVEDTYYLPTELDGKTIDPGKVAAMADAKQSREMIEKFDPVPFGSVSEKDDEMLRERTIRTAVNSGFWATNENGTDLILMVPFAGGGALPLVDANGNRLNVGFLTATESDVAPLKIPDPVTGPGLF